MMEKKEIEAELAKIEGDERLQYSPAPIDVNGPLAIIQIEMKTRINTLREVLGKPPLRFHGKD